VCRVWWGEGSSLAMFLEGLETKQVLDLNLPRQLLQQGRVPVCLIWNGSLVVCMQDKHCFNITTEGLSEFKVDLKGRWFCR